MQLPRETLKLVALPFLQCETLIRLASSVRAGPTGRGEYLLTPPSFFSAMPTNASKVLAAGPSP
jgi:hypothetical protein